MCVFSDIEKRRATLHRPNIYIYSPNWLPILHLPSTCRTQNAHAKLDRLRSDADDLKLREHFDGDCAHEELHEPEIAQHVDRRPIDARWQNVEQQLESLLLGVRLEDERLKCGRLFGAARRARAAFTCLQKSLSVVRLAGEPIVMFGWCRLMNSYLSAVCDIMYLRKRAGKRADGGARSPLQHRRGVFENRAVLGDVVLYFLIVLAYMRVHIIVQLK